MGPNSSSTPTHAVLSLVSYLTSQSLDFLIHKMGKLINTKTNNLIQKWAKDLNSHFTKEAVRMANTT